MRTWSDIVPFLRRAGLLGRASAMLSENGSCFAPKIRDQLTAADVVAKKNRQTIRNETAQIGRAIAELSVPAVLLKGAAYEALKLPNASGRFSSDIDLMVPYPYLKDAEELLLKRGWVPLDVSSYDEKYYRNWMHEIPPLRHRLRGTYLDLHHTIVPPTSRYDVDADLLFQDAAETAYGGLYTLSPPDLVLHSAVHLFSDTEFNHALRDLFDIYDLISAFSTSADFMERLVQRSFALDLQRPLYYALICISGWLEAELPDSARPLLARARPFWPIARLMELMLQRTIVPPNEQSLTSQISSWLLFCRGHYLRMPMRLLIPHLVRKAVTRAREARDQEVQ